MTIMMLPFFHSLRSILEDNLRELINLVPQGLYKELENYHVVDTHGVIVWSLAFLLLGVVLGYTSRGRSRERGMGARDAQVKAIFGQMSKVDGLLPAATKQRADLATRTFGSQVFSRERDVDYYAVASGALRDQFGSLKRQERDVLVSYVLFQGLKTIEGGLLGGLDEVSEMTSLRLQMAMDRRSKFISTLSQMIKKISTTQDILVQNIK
jgi:hypothetical protein